MYRRIEDAQTLSDKKSTTNKTNTNDNQHHHRNNNQESTGASTSAGVSSIVDSLHNMDQLKNSGHIHSKLQKKGNLVTFYRNGDQHYKGVTMSISQKWFITLETLILYLNNKISTPTGIKYIFLLSSKEQVKDVTDFKPGESYIVSSVKKVISNVKYGESPEYFWKNKPVSAGKIRKHEKYLFIKNYEEIKQNRLSQLLERDSKKQRNHVKKKIERKIIIISNTHRQSLYVLNINREQKVKLKELLDDISDSLELSNPPIQNLYTSSIPRKKVLNYEQLFREYLHEERFIACGSELFPTEVKGATQSLKSNENDFHSLEYSDYNEGKSSNSQESKSTQINKRLNEVPKNHIKNASYSKTNSHLPQHSKANGKDKGGISSHSTNPTSKKSSNKQYSLKLDWIYGFDSSIFDNPLGVISPDELIYCVGKIAIIYNVVKYKQRYFMKHTSDISCFATHGNRKYVASAQCKSDRESFVLIWDVNEFNVINMISGGILEKIISINFSNDKVGEFLMILDSSNSSQNQTIKIYDWKNNCKVANTKCNHEEVKAGRFHSEDNTTLVTYGYQHINIWRVFLQEKGCSKILRDKKSGIFNVCTPEYVTCVTFDLMGNILSGDSNGSIHLWSLNEEEAFINRTVHQLFHAHKDNVSCILFLGDGTMISTSNSSIKAWDSFNDFKFVKERNISSQYGNIKTIISCHPEKIDGKLWIVTDNSVVLEGTLQDSFIVLFQNHGTAKIPLQLSTSPNDHYFITGGPDKVLMKWSMLQQKVIWTSQIDSECSAISYYISGQYIAIGTFNGKLIIVQTKTGAHVMSLQVDQNQKKITCLEYSPNGKLLCAGCAKSDLKMFTILDKGAFCRLIVNMDFKNSINVLRIDWSIDSQTIRTEDAELNIKIWSISPNVKEIEDDNAEKNKIDFATENCLMKYRKIVDDITVVKKTMKIEHVIYGTSSGAIGLVKSPFTALTAIDQLISTSIGNIKTVGLSFDDNYALVSSFDKNCSSIFQWSITNE